MIPVATTPFCYSRKKATKDNTYVNKHGSFPRKPSLGKRGSRPDLAHGHSWPTPMVGDPFNFFGSYFLCLPNMDVKLKSVQVTKLFDSMSIRKIVPVYENMIYYNSISIAWCFSFWFKPNQGKILSKKHFLKSKDTVDFVPR